MTTPAPLPPPSPGVVVAPFLEGLVAFDPRTSEIHVLRGSAEVVWRACTEGLTALDLAAAVAEAGGGDAAAVQADVEAFVGQLRAKGLVGRGGPLPAPPSVPVGPVTGRHRSGAVVVLDERIVVRSDDPALVAQVDAGFGTVEAGATLEVALERDGGGAVHLRGRGDGMLLGGEGSFLPLLASALNQVAATSSSVLALHAGGVQAPSGEVVLLSAPSESGKSTLTAGLVRAGWGYLGDEAIGVRAGSLRAVPYPKPFSLRPESRQALGLDRSAQPVVAGQLRPGARLVTEEVGPVAVVVLPRFRPEVPPRPERLEPEEALVAVAENAFNLAVAGPVALAALAALAAEVPVVRLVHGGGPEAVAAVEAVVAGLSVPVGRS